MIKTFLKLIYRSVVIFLAKLDWLTSGKNDAIITGDIVNLKLVDVLIYVHWSKDLKPTSGEIELLKQSAKAGLQNILVLNLDSKSISEQSLHEWKGLYTEIILRKNVGRDLAAYRSATSILDVSKVKSIYFFNNSVIWLPSKMRKFLQQFISWDQEIYSATVSYQPVRHMQSFALGAKGRGVPILLEEIKKIRNTRSKRATISFGEIRVSRNLTKAKIRFSNGFFQYSDLIKEALNKTSLLSQPKSVINPAIEARLNMIRGAVVNGTPLNPTHHTWLELYNLGFPGLKKDLLGKNKTRIPDLTTYEQYLQKVDSKVLDMETIGFLTFPKTHSDRLRRKLGF